MCKIILTDELLIPKEPRMLEVLKYKIDFIINIFDILIIFSFNQIRSY